MALLPLSRAPILPAPGSWELPAAPSCLLDSIMDSQIGGSSIQTSRGKWEETSHASLLYTITAIHGKECINELLLNASYNVKVETLQGSRSKIVELLLHYLFISSYSHAILLLPCGHIHNRSGPSLSFPITSSIYSSFFHSQDPSSPPATS